MNGKKSDGTTDLMILYRFKHKIQLAIKEDQKILSLEETYFQNHWKTTKLVKNTFPISSKYLILCTENLPYFTEYEQSQLWTKNHRKSAKKA